MWWQQAEVRRASEKSYKLAVHKVRMAGRKLILETGERFPWYVVVERLIKLLPVVTWQTQMSLINLKVSGWNTANASRLACCMLVRDHKRE